MAILNDRHEGTFLQAIPALHVLELFGDGLAGIIE